MTERGMYFMQPALYSLVRSLGGQWGDKKVRPVVCLIHSHENPDLYWAIPVGNWDHRDAKAQQRINDYMAYPVQDLRSCYYHIGKTTTKSIFFISDVLPVIDKYLDKEYFNKYSSKQHIVRSAPLLNELERKLERILAYEKGSPNYFRQHITDVKNEMMRQLGQPSKQLVTV